MAFSSQIKLALGVVVGFLLISVTYAAPASESSQNQDLAEQISALQKQLAEIQNAIGQQQVPEDPKTLQNSQVEQLLQAPQAPQVIPNRALRSMAWQPMKRMVAWQPMKRSDAVISSDFSREQLIKAIEKQLSDVLHAGETLGISAEDVLTHLRQEQGGSPY
ncbi:hypothetical protein FO519_008606 [Halicephalobus sp. NKZ332]|nr:hypothetical protein FO519_008606 [Halicephalobus sp. NKZ332]